MEAPSRRTKTGGTNNQSQKGWGSAKSRTIRNDRSRKLSPPPQLLSSREDLHFHSGYFFSHSRRTCSSRTKPWGKGCRPSLDEQTWDITSLSLATARVSLLVMSGNVNRIQPSTQRVEATSQSRNNPRRQFITSAPKHPCPTRIVPHHMLPGPPRVVQYEPEASQPWGSGAASASVDVSATMAIAVMVAVSFIGVLSASVRLAAVRGEPSARSLDSNSRAGARESGESGIRTHDGLAPMPVFKTGALNRSAISPIPARDRYNQIRCPHRALKLLSLPYSSVFSRR
jgi:hypothetical protein